MVLSQMVIHKHPFMSNLLRIFRSHSAFFFPPSDSSRRRARDASDGGDDGDDGEDDGEEQRGRAAAASGSSKSTKLEEGTTTAHSGSVAALIARQVAKESGAQVDKLVGVLGKMTEAGAQQGTGAPLVSGWKPAAVPTPAPPAAYTQQQHAWQPAASQPQAPSVPQDAAAPALSNLQPGPVVG
ncbi:hypothetical protein PLESTB_000187300 [Pleodorina starrii]|uniref:Uncharacterized protein n=1 Tax=Pleodorina starrii TaxID=330485 RepID=A0A9W6BCR6_9CHLO|nr:hypothetical protein PLESTB_000187300 [Pleodorina starrii]